MGAQARWAVFGAGMDVDVAYLWGQAIGTRLAAGRLVIGSDGLPESALLHEALCSGALRTGCTVYDVGTVPTPALYFAKDRFWADGAAMVSAAHQPQRGSRLSLSLGKLPATDLDLAELAQTVELHGPFALGRGQLVSRDILESYRSFLVAHFVPAEPLPLVIASPEGGPLHVAGDTLRLLGYPVIHCPLCEPNGATATSVPVPPLDALRRAISPEGGRIGALYTENGSRAVFVDETGTALSPSQVLAMLAGTLLRFEPGSQVIYDQRLGTAVAREIQRIGGEPIAAGPGTGSVKQLLLERGAVIGADAEGGYCFRTMGTEDALYATLVMLRIASHAGGALRPRLSQLDL